MSYERDVYYQGIIVYRNLFLKIIKLDNQENVRKDYIKYIACIDNNVVMSFACKKDINPYLRYLELKNASN